MEQRDPRQIQAALSKPFAPEDLEWRLQQTFEEKMRSIAVPYVTNRAIQNRLDEVVGPENWCNKYRPWIRFTVKVRDKEDYKKWVEKEVISQLCGISIYFPDRDRWICKWDGAEITDIEAVKGGLSDSMKRAAVQWGVGRVLYNMDTVWVNVEKRGKTYVIKESERPKLDNEYLKMLQRLGLTPSPPFGTQAQLTPTPSRETPQAGQTSAPAGEPQREGPPPAQPPRETGGQTETPPPQGSGNVVDLPQPAYEYIVESATVQNGMSSQSTAVVLKDAEGKTVKAFARGLHAALTPGAALTQVKLSVKKQGTVVFYFLESYELAGSTRTA